MEGTVVVIVFKVVLSPILDDTVVAGCFSDVGGDADVVTVVVAEVGVVDIVRDADAAVRRWLNLGRDKTSVVARAMFCDIGQNKIRPVRNIFFSSQSPWFQITDYSTRILCIFYL